MFLMNLVVIVGSVLTLGLLIWGAIRLWIYLFGYSKNQKCKRCSGKGHYVLQAAGSGFRAIPCDSCAGAKYRSVHVPGKFR